MDTTRKLGFLENLEKLSPKEKILEEIERGQVVENVVGLIPAGDSTDTSLLVTNLGVILANKGFNICILDAKVFYPNIYKLLNCRPQPKGKGLFQALRSDKIDFRDEVIESRIENLFIMSPSPSDLIEDYLDINEEDVERVITTLKDMFDYVLIDIPNIPPLEFCYVPIKQSNMGFTVWSERADCPQNTTRLLHFMSSIGIGVSKFTNIILNNGMGHSFDKDIISEMKMKLIAELPFVPGVVDYSLEGRPYVISSVLMNKKYKAEIEKLASIISR